MTKQRMRAIGVCSAATLLLACGGHTGDGSIAFDRIDAAAIAEMTVNGLRTADKRKIAHVVQYINTYRSGFTAEHSFFAVILQVQFLDKHEALRR